MENKPLSVQTQLSQVNGQQGRCVPKTAPATDGHYSSPDSCSAGGRIQGFCVPPTAGPCEQLNRLFLPTQSALFREGSFISGPYCHCLIRLRFKGARCEMTQIAPSLRSWPVCTSNPCKQSPCQTQPLSAPLHEPGLQSKGSGCSAIPSHFIPRSPTWVQHSGNAAEGMWSCSHIPPVSHVSPGDRALSGCG